MDGSRMMCPINGKECTENCAWHLEFGDEYSTWKGCAIVQLALGLNQLKQAMNEMVFGYGLVVKQKGSSF